MRAVYSIYKYNVEVSPSRAQKTRERARIFLEPSILFHFRINTLCESDGIASERVTVALDIPVIIFLFRFTKVSEFQPLPSIFRIARTPRLQRPKGLPYHLRNENQTHGLYCIMLLLATMTHVLLENEDVSSLASL